MLKLESVSVAFPAAGGGIRPVDGVSLEVGETERHMIVGETGSGKSADSHWNGKGAALAADAVNKAVGRSSGYFDGPFTREEVHKGNDRFYQL